MARHPYFILATVFFFFLGSHPTSWSGMEPSYEGSKNPTLELISKLRAFRITLTTHNIKLNTYIYLFLWKVKACNYLQLHQNPFMSFTAPLWTSKKQKLNPRSPEKSSPIKDQTCLQNMTIIYHRSLFCSKISSIIPVSNQQINYNQLVITSHEITVQ